VASFLRYNHTGVNSKKGKGKRSAKTKEELSEEKLPATPKRFQAFMNAWLNDLPSPDDPSSFTHGFDIEGINTKFRRVFTDLRVRT
jgi:hypothetical protein